MYVSMIGVTSLTLNKSIKVNKKAYEVNKLKNEDGYSCFYAFVQLSGHSSKSLTFFIH